MKKIVFLFIFACLNLFSSLFASHFVGAEMYYEHLGGCNYRLYHTTFIDCAGQGANAYLPPNINLPHPEPVVTLTGIGCNLSNIIPTWVVYTTSDVTNMCPGSLSSCYSNGTPVVRGVLEITYYTDLSFCNLSCNAVLVQFNDCCRSYTATSGAAGENLYIELLIPLNGNNNSPCFISPPITFLQMGEAAIFQQTAYDKDGDSLVYAFSPCYQALGQAITYNPGYSPTTVLGSTWTSTINPQTGEINFIPITGSTVTAVLGIQVKEYRNGVLLVHINRDIQISVINVNSSTNTEPIATISSISGTGFQNPPTTLRTSVGYPLIFQLTVIDPDTAQLLSYRSNIANQFPNATLTANTNTSPMTLTFSWTPNAINANQNYPLLIDVFDNNCFLNGHYHFTTNIQIDSAYLSSTIIDSDCMLATGSIDLSLYANSPPYTYSWNTGDTTQDLINIPSGAYIVAISNANGGFWITDTFFVNTIGLSSSINQVNPDCSIANGSLSIEIFGGQGGYTYTWSNGMMGDSINNLGIGGYSVNVYDSVGCFYHTATVLNYSPMDSCFSIIEGIAYYDKNGNCIQDSGEVGISNIYIDIVPGGATFTDINGHYSFIVNDTGTYQLQTILFNHPNTTSNCLPLNFTKDCTISLLGTGNLATHFPLIFQPDLSVYLGENGYVAGFNHTTYIHCYNTGFDVDTAILFYQFEPTMLNPVFNPSPTTYNNLTHAATWHIPNFVTNMQYNVFVTSVVDANATLGDIVKSYTTIMPTVNDITLHNNVDTVIKTIVVAIDPNYKEVSPTGQTQYGLIPSNTEKLEYTIHFQNTGNWPATYVIVRDTIDVNALDITTTEIQMTSHACNVTVEQDSILVFTFNNINLPDSTTNEAASHGFAKYSIKLLPNLPLYTTIENSASIYFDFNAPIKTNTTVNTLYNQMNIAIQKDSITCPQDSIIAVITGGRPPYQFEWSTGFQDNNNTTGQSQINGNLTTGTYSVAITDYYGLMTFQDFDITNVNPANANFIYTHTGNNYYFAANNNNYATYFWDFGNGQSSNAPTGTAYYPQNGVYTVTLIVTDFCGEADTSTQTILLNVNNESSLFQQQTQLSPNPTKDNIQLSFPNKKQQAYTLTIFDANGKAVKTIANIFNNQIVVSVRDWASGTYFWELKGEESAGGKFVKE